MNQVKLGTFSEPFAVREGQVSSALSGAFLSAERLASSVGLLASRLEQVLGTPPDAKSEAPHPEYTCDLAQRIDRLGDMIRGLDAHVTELLARLEL